MRYSYIIIAFAIITSCDSKSTVARSHANDSEKAVEFVSGAYQNLSVSQAMTISEVVFLDVRTQGEVDKGAVPNSLHLDFRMDNFQDEVSKLDKSKSYVVYCHSGARSAKASKMMIDLGFEKVANMAGGYSKYKDLMQ